MRRRYLPVGAICGALVAMGIRYYRSDIRDGELYGGMLIAGGIGLFVLYACWPLIAAGFQAKSATGRAVFGALTSLVALLLHPTLAIAVAIVAGVWVASAFVKQLPERRVSVDVATAVVAVHPQQASKRCPMCAEDVKAAARICRFCGHTFDGKVLDVDAESRE